ncbi:tRNA (adenosine(37)-N6)-threonylcarbamoyltransferase complex dimerization subunit type 1 TsaB [Acetobacteraceae bacterium]|nr:tRNA (adenosine(37)-N6)-threonylcarbamoyltransferase complex dimerization subunit type 1 TsaB [Acetobacteraceae bacterium]
MISLVLNGACVGVEKGNLVAAVKSEERLLAQEFIEGRTGSNLFPEVTSRILEKILPQKPDQIAAVRGPGSFTGLRSSLALAKGLSMGWQCPLKGVSLGNALRQTVSQTEAVVISLARRGYVFVDFPHAEIRSLPIEEALSLFSSDIKMLAGDALAGSQKIPELLEKALNLGIEIAQEAYPSAVGIVKAAADLPDTALDWLPLYIDPPKISRPKVGMRPPPFEDE